MRSAGEARIGRTERSLIVRINRSDTFRVAFYSIPLSGLRKVLEGDADEVPVFRVRR